MNIKLVTKLGQKGYKELICKVLFASSQEVMSLVFITLKKLVVFSLPLMGVVFYDIYL